MRWLILMLFPIIGSAAIHSGPAPSTTAQLPAIADGTLLGNTSGGTAAPSAITALPSGVLLPPQAAFTQLGNATSASAAPTALPIVNYVCANSGDDVGINAALATGKAVHVMGTCSITQQINVSSGQCLYGDGDHKTKLVAGSGFAPSATGLIVLTGSELNAPCVHDLIVLGVQPTGFSTTASADQASGTTIQVASAANMSVGNYVQDTTVTTAIPLQTTITNIAGTTLTLSATVTGLLTGDTIIVNPSRTNYVALGTCNSTYTGCQYPPGIYAVGAGRLRAWKLHMEGMWNCINTVIPGAGTPSNTPVWLENIECGALNIGWEADGAQDFSHVKGWHTWNWGFQGTSGSGYSRAFADGSTVAWSIGRMDGLNATDLTFENAKLVLTANANNSVAVSLYENVHTDSYESGFLIQGGIANFFSNVQIAGYTHTATCPFTVTGGTTFMQHVWLQESGTQSTDSVCVSGGSLKIMGGLVYGGLGTFHAFSQTAGTLDIEGMQWKPPATLSVPYVSATGGGVTVVKGNTTANTGTGTIISIGTDNRNNAVQGNWAQQYSYSLPMSSTSLGFYSTGIQESTSGSSIEIGAGANYGTTGSANNTLVGVKAGAATTTATGNTALGFQALSSLTAATNSTAIGANAAGAGSGGGGTTAVGNGALSVVAGNNNSALGGSACNKITSGASNLCLGASVGSTTLVTGGSNILIGTSSAIDTLASSTSNEINIGGALIGYNIAPTVTSGFGTSPSVAGGNTFAFQVTEGATGSPTTTGVLGMPTAPNDWICSALDRTSASITARQSGAASTTAVTITFSSAPANGDVVQFQCNAR
jgi:hypothetical protein